MTTLSMTLIALLALSIAAYVQMRIPVYTTGRESIAWARGILLVVGIALGYVGLRTYQEPYGARALLAFAIGFGLVHLPAALILFFKRVRGSGKS